MMVNLKKRKKQLYMKKAAIMVEQDIQGHPDPERARKEYMGMFRRLFEYNENIKRDPNDPKWECCSDEGY